MRGIGVRFDAEVVGKSGGEAYKESTLERDIGWRWIGVRPSRIPIDFGSMRLFHGI